MKHLSKFKNEKVITFILILFLALISCSIFLKFHMVTDTYWNIELGYENYKLEPLKDGRIINYIFLSIAEIMHMPFKLYQFIMMALSILFYSISVFLIYEELLERLENKDKIHKIILLLGSFAIIFNPITVETFAYTEVVMSLSILLGTKAAILLKDDNIKSTLQSLFLVIFMGLCYQGTVNFFITLSIFLFAISGKQNIKSRIKQLLKIVLILLITMAVTLAVLNMSNAFLNRNQNRLGNSFNLIQAIEGSINFGMNMITILNFNLFPEYLIVIFIMLGVLLIGLSITKKEDVTSIFKYLFVVIVSIFSCTFPIFFQTEPLISARMSFSVGAIIGVTICYVLLIQDKKNKMLTTVLLIISTLAIAINIYDYITLGLMNLETQRQEKEYINKINDCIIKYEKDNNITITKASMIIDQNVKYTYSNFPNNTFTTRAIYPHYSNIHTLNYYTNRKLQWTKMDIDIYLTYFAGKDFEEFEEEQIKFKDDTVYICIY